MTPQRGRLHGSGSVGPALTRRPRATVPGAALKVVGVGSVGTRCKLVLFEGRDADDPFLLQVKEAGASVLETHLGPSSYDTPGERVVTGSRLIQASGDIFLGWSATDDGHHYYWRQFHDMKGSADVAFRAAIHSGRIDVADR